MLGLSEDGGSADNRPESRKRDPGQGPGLMIARLSGSFLGLCGLNGSYGSYGSYGGSYGLLAGSQS